MSLPELKQVCAVKSQRWPYSMKDCLGWMEFNLKDDDLHIMMKELNAARGYCNLVKIEVLINDVNEKMLGLGSVCTSESSRGYGTLLMNEVNKVLLENQSQGLLFCKDELVPYYQKFSWEQVPADKIQTDNFKGINFMVFNVKKIITSLKYNGRNF